MDALTPVYLTVDVDGWTHGMQLAISQEGYGGYRLYGPKYNGSSKQLLRADLDQRDAAEIRRYLDRRYPVAEVTPSPAWSRWLELEQRHGPFCGECGRAWRDASPGCPHRINNVHPLISYQPERVTNDQDISSRIRRGVWRRPAGPDDHRPSAGAR